jgi:hypothetical protein
MTTERFAHSPIHVMAGLDPAIHVLLAAFRKTWMLGIKPDMTVERSAHSLIHVMAGLDPAIHVLLAAFKKDVDHRVTRPTARPGDDG